MPFLKVCKRSDIPKGAHKGVSLLGKKIGIFNRDGEFYAISVSCRHQGADLTKGVRRGDILVCPRHHWEFNIYTGECLTEAALPLQRFPLKIEEGIVYVDPMGAES